MGGGVSESHTPKRKRGAVRPLPVTRPALQDRQACPSDVRSVPIHAHAQRGARVCQKLAPHRAVWPPPLPRHMDRTRDGLSPLRAAALRKETEGVREREGGGGGRWRGGASALRLFRSFRFAIRAGRPPAARSWRLASSCAPLALPFVLLHQTRTTVRRERLTPRPAPLPGMRSPLPLFQSPASPPPPAARTTPPPPTRPPAAPAPS